MDSSPTSSTTTTNTTPSTTVSLNSTNTSNSTIHTSPILPNDNLTCQWQACGERLPCPEDLYDHVCERHVGRKSTNNLSLTCQWGNCRTTTVKRDHITSHIRVHVPLKPHKCEFCGKAFKRPQDLKKHVKTHADDSDLMRNPEPTRPQNHGINSSYALSAGKLVADLQSLAANANGYYTDGHQMNSTQANYYSNAGVSHHPTYHGGAVPTSSTAYGPVYYAVSQPQNANAEYELRKRAAFDALNEFFGDAKRRVIDPNTYYDVGQRLAGLNNVQLPMLHGYGVSSAADNHYATTATAHATQHQQQQQQQQPMFQNHYSLPLPNLRTKTDLLNIDQFLDQLQTTVYENSTSAAATQPMQHHSASVNVAYRPSHSPPSSGRLYATTPGASSGNETPALTPASSVLSYPSAHSPGSSVHSSHGGGHAVSPISSMSRSSIVSSNANMYPTLPSVSAMSDFSSSSSSSSHYGNSHGHASMGGMGSLPAAGLASAFDADGRRRYSGGILQRARPTSNPTTFDTHHHLDHHHHHYNHDNNNDTKNTNNDGDKTPTMSSSSVRKSSSSSTSSAQSSPSSPHHSTTSSSSSSSSSSGSKEQGLIPDDAWVENIRIIVALRSFIRERLEKRDYVEDDAGGEREEEGKKKKSRGGVVDRMEIDGEVVGDDDGRGEMKELYPVLKAL